MEICFRLVSIAHCRATFRTVRKGSSLIAGARGGLALVQFAQDGDILARLAQKHLGLLMQRHA